MSTYSLKSRMDEVSERLAYLASLPVLDAEQMAGRVIFEHAGRHVMQEINRRLPDTPPPEGFPIFCERWTAFVQKNIAMEQASKERDLRVSYETGRRDQISANASLAGTATWVPDACSAVTADDAAPDDALAVKGHDATRQVAAEILASAYAPGYDPARPEIFVSTSFDKPPRSPVPPTPFVHSSTKTTARRVYPKGTKLLSHWLRDYLIADGSKRNNRTADRDVRPYVEFMIEFLGDRPLEDYAFEEFEQLNIAMCAIPTRWSVPPAHRTSLMLRYRYAQTVKFVGCDKLTETTIIDRYGNGLNRFFGWLKKKRNIAIQRPEWEIYGDVSGALTKTSFNDEEGTALFTMSLFVGHDPDDRWTKGTSLTQTGIYWSYILEVICGLRPSESAQLQPGDLKMLDGFMYFDLRPFDPANGRVLLSQMRQQKSDNASRFVVAPPLLGDLGFFDLAAIRATQGHSRILCDIAPKILSGKDKDWGAAMSRDWQTRKKVLNFKRQNVSAYSGRHLLKDLLKAFKIDEVDQERMMGHAVSKVSRGYGSKEGYDPEVAARIYAADTPFLKWLRETLVGAYERAKAAGTLVIPDVPRS